MSCLVYHKTISTKTTQLTVFRDFFQTLHHQASCQMQRNERNKRVCTNLSVFTINVENQIYLMKQAPILSHQISPRTLHFGNAAVT